MGSDLIYNAIAVTRLEQSALDNEVNQLTLGCAWEQV